MSDSFEQAVIAFTRAVIETFHVLPVRCRVDFLEDPDHPLSFHLGELRQVALYHSTEQKRQPPPEGPAAKK
jgi:hypothetical protein